MKKYLSKDGSHSVFATQFKSGGELPHGAFQLETTHETECLIILNTGHECVVEDGDWIIKDEINERSRVLPADFPVCTKMPNELFRKSFVVPVD